MTLTQPAWLAPGLEILRRGGVLACATETLMGLLADATDRDAVQRVVDLKRRGPEPIALLLPSREALKGVAGRIPKAAEALAERYWPGPLTLVVPARAGLSPALAPAGTIGVRVPGESPALRLVQAFGKPLTATSCNHSGRPPARTEAEARAIFAAELPLIVPADAPGGAPSTVVDTTGAALRVLREGAIRLSLG